MTQFTFTILYENNDAVTLSDTLSFDDVQRVGISGMRVSINKAQLFEIHLEEGQQLIYRHRRIQSSGVKDENQIEPDIYLMGWRQKVGGRDVQSITYICDWVGRGFQIHQAGRFDDNHPWFYPPTLHENEVFEGEKFFDNKTHTWKIK